MGMNIITFEILMGGLLNRRPIEEDLSAIVRNIEEEFVFSSLGLFLKVAKSDIFRLKIGRNLSHTFAKSTIFTSGDPLINELMDFQPLEIKYPGRYMFEKEYSHLLIAPLFYQEELLGFLFLDKEENFFEISEITAFKIFASLISLVVANDMMTKEIDQHRDFYETLQIYSMKAFQKNAEMVFSISRRYNREFVLAVMKLANHKNILRTFGEKKTNEMMNSIATFLQKDLRQADIIGRLDKDSFVIAMPETSTKNGIVTIQRLDDKINKLALMKSSTLGWGLKDNSDTAADLEMLIKAAEEAASESTRKGNKKIIIA